MFTRTSKILQMVKKPIEKPSSGSISEEITYNNITSQSQIAEHSACLPSMIPVASSTSIQDVVQNESCSHEVAVVTSVANEVLDYGSDDSVADPNYEVSSSSEESEIENAAEVLTENLENNEVAVRKGKKRQKHPETWKRNVWKKKVAGGQEHQYRKKFIAAKELKPPCKPSCYFKCSAKISEDMRIRIHSEFWQNTKSMAQKRQFVASMVQSIPVARTREENGKRSGKRQFTRKYGFDVNRIRTAVCQKFFLSTLSISETFVTTALRKKMDGGIVSEDQRGKQESKNKISELMKQGVRDHINKFPIIESHYSRERSKRKYLGSHLNVSRMYELYKTECTESNLPESNIAKQWLYTEIFQTEFNLSFKLPYNDTCDECDKLLLAINEALGIEKNNINSKYQEHLLEASKRYELKRIDRQRAAESNGEIKMLTVDLQKCLPTPVLTNAQSFYKLKLWTYNYTIKDSSKHSSTNCMMWDESKSGRGANEMASGFIKWAETIPLNVSEVTLWSDNCPSQNRNIIMVMAYFWILHENPTLKVINHKFLLRGHTHLEVDGDHSLIERERKRTPCLQIMTPWDWQQIARLCSRSQPFKVVNMELNDFKDVKVLYSTNTSPFIIRKKTTTNEDFQMSKVVHLQVRREDMGMLFFKTDFSSELFQCVDLNRTGRRILFPVELPALRNDSNPISSKKFNHLQSVLPWVPHQFHDFYKNLIHSDSASDDI